MRLYPSQSAFEGPRLVAVLALALLSVFAVIHSLISPGIRNMTVAMGTHGDGLSILLPALLDEAPFLQKIPASEPDMNLQACILDPSFTYQPSTLSLIVNVN